MTKRLVALLLVVVLGLSAMTTAFAADNAKYTFEPIVAQNSTLITNPKESTVDGESRAMVAALLYFELYTYQILNEMELETRGINKDCIVVRLSNGVGVIYDCDDQFLLVAYNADEGTITANYQPAAGDGTLSWYYDYFDKEGYTVFIAESDEWCGALSGLLTMATEALEK